MWFSFVNQNKDICAKSIWVIFCKTSIWRQNHIYSLFCKSNMLLFSFPCVADISLLSFFFLIKYASENCWQIAIAFTYWRNGNLISCKYRDINKRFWQVSISFFSFSWFNVTRWLVIEIWIFWCSSYFLLVLVEWIS